MRKLAISSLISYMLLIAPASAAEFSCAYRYVGLKLWGLSGVAEEDRDGWSNLCTAVLISGRILSDDAANFNGWLDENPFVKTVYLRSPGGDVRAAMSIGRVIRSRLMSTSSDRHGVESRTYILMEHEEQEAAIKKVMGKLADCNQRGCCFSSCVLILAAGASYRPGNIGLHRPSSEDFASLPYTAIKQTLTPGLSDIKDYLDEMEMSPELYSVMTEVASDKLLLLSEDKAFELMTGQPYDLEEAWQAFPPSIYEWVKPRCSKTSDPVGCMITEVDLESIRMAKKRLGIQSPEGMNVWR